MRIQQEPKEGMQGLALLPVTSLQQQTSVTTGMKHLKLKDNMNKKIIVIISKIIIFYQFFLVLVLSVAIIVGKKGQEVLKEVTQLG